MIWFGSLQKLLPPPAVRSHAGAGERDRMRLALEWVAARAPHLAGAELIQTLADTGLVDPATAARLLPQFHQFDPDRYFAEHLRRLSFRGAGVADEFRQGIHRVVEDVVGGAQVGEIGPEIGVRFRSGEHEGVVLAHPTVSLSIGGGTREAIAAAVEEMPDALVVVAKNFDSKAAAQLSGMLARTGVPGTLVTVNLLLGIRAITLRYQPGARRVVELLGAGRPLRSADIARLGNREEARAAAQPDGEPQ
jgi:hypothetical protein